MLGGYMLWHARIIVGFGSLNSTFSESKWESQSNERPLLANYTCKIAHWKAIMNSLKYVPPIECIQYPNWLHQFSQLIRCCLFGVETWKKQDPLRQEVPNYFILEDFMTIIFSSCTWRHHLCHKTAKHGHPSKDTQRHSTKWNHKKTLSIKTTEPPPPPPPWSPLPPSLLILQENLEDVG